MVVTFKLIIFRCLVPGVCGGDPPMKTDSHQLKVADYVREQNIRGGELFILLSDILDHFDPHWGFWMTGLCNCRSV